MTKKKVAPVLAPAKAKAPAPQASPEAVSKAWGSVLRSPARRETPAVCETPVVRETPMTPFPKQAAVVERPKVARPDVCMSGVAADELLAVLGEARKIISRLPLHVATNLTVRHYLTEEMEGAESILRIAIGD